MVAVRLCAECVRSRRRQPYRHSRLALPSCRISPGVRMRANCDCAIARVACGSGMTGVSVFLRQTEAAGAIASTRGLRADWPAGGASGSDGPLAGGLDVNSASAACRALLIRSRSSLRGCGWCCRVLSKICSERLIHLRYRTNDWLMLASPTWEVAALSASSVPLAHRAAPVQNLKTAS